MFHCCTGYRRLGFAVCDAFHKFQSSKVTGFNLHIWLIRRGDSKRLQVKVKSLSRVWLFATPWTVAYQAPPSMGGVLEWIAISFSRGSSQPRNRTRVSGIAGRRFIIWATREAQRLRTWVSVLVSGPCKSVASPACGSRSGEEWLVTAWSRAPVFWPKSGLLSMDQNDCRSPSLKCHFWPLPRNLELMVLITALLTASSEVGFLSEESPPLPCGPNKPLHNIPGCAEVLLPCNFPWLPQADFDILSTQVPLYMFYPLQFQLL